MNAWRALAAAGAAIGCVGYAVLAHHAASVSSPGLFEASVFIAPMMAFAAALAWRSPRRAWWLVLWVAAAGALVLARERLGAGTHWVLLAQHVGINAMMALVFARTLAPGAVPLISRLAAMVHGELTPRLVRYTRAVTWAWVIFFALTVAVTLVLFAFAPLPVWSGFVNLLSMPLLGAMFVGEYAVRVLLIPREERSTLFKSVAAWRSLSARKSAGTE